MLATLALAFALQSAGPEKPVLAEFMGVNGHTVQFRPALYAPTCRKVRDYHSFEWDMGKETDFTPRFPEARNRVNWNHVYGSWVKEGFEVDVCIMFPHTPPDSWKDLKRDAKAYGLAFAKAFGPSSATPLAASVEIGNEPGHYDDPTYRTLFESMAAGFREGDPKLRIATCNITAGKSGKYEKSVECVRGLDPLYDILNVHTYAMAEGWPTWRRSFPEDPKISYLKDVERVIAWRNENAKGKEVWITEFGWDACTRPAPKTGDFSKWEDVSDEDQARYLVRSFLVFSTMDVRRAYIYFFNDADDPSYHGSSGLTRNFEPKPAYHAVAHLYRALGEYRFQRAVVRRDGELFDFEFIHGKDARRKVRVLWSPTGSGRTAAAELSLGPAKVVKAERMALAAGAAPGVEAKPDAGTLKLTVGEDPVFVWLEE